MDDKHKLFLQFIMAKRIAQASEIRNFFLKYCVDNQKKVQNPNEIIVAFAKGINNHLRPLELEVKKGVDEETGHTFFALVNSMDSQITRLSTFYTVPELELFKKLLVLILESEDGEITSSTALNIADQLEHRMSKSEAEQIIKKFTENQILRNKEGLISLTSYCVMELDTFLRTHYSDYLKICNLCKQVVLKDRSCTKCEGKFHFYCVSSFFKDKRESHCPKCKTTWTTNTDELEIPTKKSRSLRRS